MLHVLSIIISRIHSAWALSLGGDLSEVSVILHWGSSHWGWWELVELLGLKCLHLGEVHDWHLRSSHHHGLVSVLVLGQTLGFLVWLFVLGLGHVLWLGMLLVLSEVLWLMVGVLGELLWDDLL